jgi:molecular chaperone GrpE
MGDKELTEDFPPDEAEPIPTSEEVTPTEETEDPGLDEAGEGAEIIDFDADAIDPKEIVHALTEELAAAKQTEADYLDRLQRVTAEFDNFRKRTLREQAQLRELGSERVLSSMLPTLDSFDAAMAVPIETDTEQRLLDGMAGTHSQLAEALGREGLTPIAAMGEAFDPSVHEAISAPPNASGPLVVIAEIRRGYKLKDRVLRPALVALGLQEEAEPISADDDAEVQDNG